VVVNAYGPTDMSTLYVADMEDAKIEEFSALYEEGLRAQEPISTILDRDNSMTTITRKLVRGGITNVILGEGSDFREWFKQKVTQEQIDKISQSEPNQVLVED
jgi:hypothetical protein